jgi:hypothetical protein
MTAVLHKGVVNAFLRWTCKNGASVLDVSTATVKQVKVRAPDGTQDTWDLVFSTKTGATGDGTDGKVEYVTDGTDVALPGTYTWQIYLELGDWEDHSLAGIFLVKDTLTGAVTPP